MSQDLKDLIGDIFSLIVFFIFWLGVVPFLFP